MKTLMACLITSAYLIVAGALIRLALEIFLVGWTAVGLVLKWSP